MRPIDTDTGKPWSYDTANLMLQRFKAQAVEALEARTERLTGGRLNRDNGYTCLVNRGDNLSVADQNLAALKHKGSEVSALYRFWYYQFCETPQSEATWSKELIGERRKRSIGDSMAAGQAVLDTLSDGYDTPHARITRAAIAASEAKPVVDSLDDEPGDVMDAGARVEATLHEQPQPKRKRGRPKGSRNRSKATVPVEV